MAAEDAVCRRVCSYPVHPGVVRRPQRSRLRLRAVEDVDDGVDVVAGGDHVRGKLSERAEKLLGHDQVEEFQRVDVQELQFLVGERAAVEQDRIISLQPLPGTTADEFITGAAVIHGGVREAPHDGYSVGAGWSASREGLDPIFGVKAFHDGVYESAGGRANLDVGAAVGAHLEQLQKQLPRALDGGAGLCAEQDLAHEGLQQ